MSSTPRKHLQVRDDCAPRRWGSTAVMVLAMVLAACVGLSGCATTAKMGAGDSASSAASAGATGPDPWENWNRKVYGFNDAVDRAVLKPVAEAYQKIVPSLVRTGISNVLGNLGDVWSAANHLLQGKVISGLDMGMRVLTNTLFGLGGLLDPATEMGLERRSEDFGQTLGRWGVPSGPYLVLPLLGPSTVRDGAALVVDRQGSVARLPPTEAGSYSLTALELINLRANLLSTTQLLDQVALDKYSFIRDGFLARRLDQVHDGAAPAGAGSDDPGDSAPPPAKPAAPAPTSPAAAPKPASKP